jgi:hypothetical protein
MRTLIGLALVLWTVGAEAAPVGPLSVYLVEPCRFVDTRESALGPLDGYRFFRIEGACDVPEGAGGVILNVTVTGGTVAGHLSIFDPLASVPPTSTLNFSAGQTIANMAIVRLTPTGQGPEGAADLVALARVPGGSVHVILDVVGYLK